MILVLFFFIGAAMTVGPWFFPQLDRTAQVFICLSGVGVLTLDALATTITRLYRKASANMAYVRTGMRGAKVIRDNGAVVVPVLHQIIPVSLETMRLNVERRGPQALITKDNLRVDLSAEFYIKVQANVDDILQAARSLGGRNVKPDAVSELVQEKLVSALRTVAATKELVELHAKRDEFASAVQEIVTNDLASNGLTLESVTISALDQTDPTQLQERNVFDAQGLRKIAEITQKARVERNVIERESERQVVERNVMTSKKVLELQRDQAEFEAEQKMKVANVRAAREREINEFKLAQDEAVSRRDIEKMKAIETAEVERTLVVEQAQVMKKITLVAKLREQEQAEILKKQTIEVAERGREVAVAEKEQERAAAQAAVLLAEAEREAAEQKIVTVQVTAEAEREAQKKLIAAQQAINEKRLREQTEADVQAYTQVKNAEGEREAATLRYEATLRLAQGESEAAQKRSEGERAVKMVDVTVERERVDVEQARVAVERQSLSNKQEFEGAALKFELEKLRIDAERDVRIQAAQAMGNMLAKAQMQVFGDPNTMALMASQFMRAASLGTAADGLLRTLPPQAQELLAKMTSAVVSQLDPRTSDVPAAAPVAAHPAGNGSSTTADLAHAAVCTPAGRS
jgi:flotillin